MVSEFGGRFELVGMFVSGFGCGSSRCSSGQLATYVVPKILQLINMCFFFIRLCLSLLEMHLGELNMRRSLECSASVLSQYAIFFYQK